MIKPLPQLALTLVLATLHCCYAQIDTANFDYGRINNNIYSNTYFNFNITIPTGWVLLSKNEYKDLQNKSIELFNEQDSSFTKTMRASLVNSANLFTAFKYQPGTNTEFNPSISMVVENISKSPAIQTGDEYLQIVRTYMRKYTTQYSFENDEIKKCHVGSKTFYKLEVLITVGGQIAYQHYYSTVINGFSVNILLCYIFDSQKKELLKALNTAHFY
jgi:hypothetical protein